MREVNHRSKNLLAVVQAVAQQIACNGKPRSFVERFAARLGGLAASHDLLIHNGWQGVDLAELVRSQLAHFGDLIGKRGSLEGPPLRITCGAAQTIGMALHELATNAGKHGSPSNTEGHVAISWKVVRASDSETFHMRWAETGGPPVKPPSHTGFGYTVMVRMTERSLDAKTDLAYEKSGLVWAIAAPVEYVLEQASSPAAGTT